MALSDLAIFTEYTYETATEVLTQNIDLFNAASEGAIILRPANHAGDYSDSAMWAKISGLVRRRNPRGTGTVGAKSLAMLTDTMVKIAAGTPPVLIDPGQFEWINKSPDEAGVVIGKQLAGDMLADMLNTAIMATKAAMSGVPAIKYDGTANTLTYAEFNNAQALYGDRAQELRVWVMHSKSIFDVWGNNLANTTGLFTGTGSGGTTAVRRDPFGRLMVVTDSPSLIEVDAISAGVPAYDVLGLATGAVIVDQNGDYTDNISTLNGNENINRSWQAEWSYNLAVKGFRWDKTSGGPAPTDATLGTSTNWHAYATSYKDLAGVILRTK